MIYKIVKGRLGNQMFQYAAMRAIQEKYFSNDDLKFYFKYVERKGSKTDGFVNSLSDFNIVDDLETKNIDISIIQKIKIMFLLVILGFLKVIIRDNKKFDEKRASIELRLQSWLNKSGIFWFTNGYCDFNYDICKEKNKVFYGYFESKQFFIDAKNILRNDFKPKFDELEKNKELYDVIRNTNSICISIRRGDFVTNPVYKKKHYVCDERYFEKAIELIQKHVDNPTYIVFSDDVEWVKNNMKFPENTYYEDGTDPVWEKLRLMYSCKHFVISNSSFSWWAQYLSSNDKKIVVAPKKWMNDGDNPDIYDDDWILV